MGLAPRIAKVASTLINAFGPHSVRSQSPSCEGSQTFDASSCLDMASGLDLSRQTAKTMASHSSGEGDVEPEPLLTSNSTLPGRSWNRRIVAAAASATAPLLAGVCGSAL